MTQCIAQPHNSGNAAARRMRTDKRMDNLPRVLTGLLLSADDRQLTITRPVALSNFPSNDRMFRDVGIAEQALNDLLMEVETLLNYKAPGSSNGSTDK